MTALMVGIQQWAMHSTDVFVWQAVRLTVVMSLRTVALWLTRSGRLWQSSMLRMNSGSLHLVMSGAERLSWP